MHMLGPFGKVPDRVTGAIFHALVQCVAPRGSQLYQNLNPICQLIAGAFVFCSPFAGFVGHFFAGLFSWPQVFGWALSVQWAHLYKAALRCLWAVLDPTASPSGLQAREKLSTPLALPLVLSQSFYLLSPFSFYLIPSAFGVPLLLSFLPVFSELFIFSCNPSELPPFHSPSPCWSLLYFHTSPFLSLFPLLTCSFSFPRISHHLSYPTS